MHIRLIFVFSFIGIKLLAQQMYLPLGRDYLITFENSLSSLNSGIHTSFKPYLQSSIPYYDSLTDYSKRYATFIDSKKRSWFWRDLLRERMINIRSGDFSMDIDPLMNIHSGKNFSDTSGGFLYTNSRAIQVQGSIGEKFSFYSDFYENQAVFLSHITTFIQKNGVAPGEGLVKPFKDKGFDYAMASGYVSYTPDKHFNFQLGHGKNFIGDGYRSLLLSDNSFNYPFLRINTIIWKIQFTNLFASFIDTRSAHALELGFQKKSASFHYLNWIVTRRIHLGLFTALIWNVTDSSESSNNVLMGTNMKIKVTNKIYGYGQFMLDDLADNKNGFQLGIRGFDLGIKNLNFQFEYNQIQPYAYTHQNPLYNYAHYNQALAHPLGANFREGLAFLQYRYKNIFVELKTIYAIYGADTSDSHWGKDIFQSDEDAENGLESSGNYITQGVKTILTYKDLRLAYLINPATNLNLIAGFSNRAQTSVLETQKSNYFYLGIATNLTNGYYDF
jgi:hypothetical protein